MTSCCPASTGHSTATGTETDERTPARVAALPSEMLGLGAAGVTVRFEDVVPVRALRWSRGDRHFSGWYWSATTGRHIGFESWLERDQLILPLVGNELAGRPGPPGLPVEAVLTGLLLALHYHDSAQLAVACRVLLDELTDTARTWLGVEAVDRTDPHQRIAFAKRVYRAFDRLTTALDPERVDRRRRLPRERADAHAATWEDTDPEHARRRAVLQQVRRIREPGPAPPMIHTAAARACPPHPEPPPDHTAEHRRPNYRVAPALRQQSVRPRNHEIPSRRIFSTGSRQPFTSELKNSCSPELRGLIRWGRAAGDLEANGWLSSNEGDVLLSVESLHIVYGVFYLGGTER